MVPMIASVEEFEEVSAIWDSTKSQLRKKRVPFDPKTKLGLMIETPAAVRMAAELAERADFFSVGTNDLVQYTTAVDRGNQHLRQLLHYWHPSLWRQLDDVVKAGHRAKIPVGICGELAGEPLAIGALIGIGFDSLSFHPNSIPKIKSLIRSLFYSECRALTKKVLASGTSDAVLKHLKNFHERSTKRSKQ